MRRPNRAGFTLLELMIVIAIIGILSGIATIKYADLLRKAEEGGLQGNLGAVRSAISIYYADTDGVYPQSLGFLVLNARYLKAMPTAKVPRQHEASALVTAGAAATDAGGWLYNDDAAHSRFGSAAVNCVHTDSKGSVWSAY